MIQRFKSGDPRERGPLCSYCLSHCGLQMFSATQVHEKITCFLWRRGHMSKLRASQSIFCPDYRGAAPRLLTRKMGKLSSTSVMFISVCLYVCVRNSWLSASSQKSVISASAEMDETLGSHSHYFEAVISHCCDGENLIVLVTRNALIVFLISFPAMWENNSQTRIPYKKNSI